MTNSDTRTTGIDVEPTVEDCLRELREMFPQMPIRLSIRQDFVLNGASRDPSDVYINIGRPNDYTYFEDVELSGLMAQVRSWKQAQSMPRLDFICDKCGVQQHADGICANCGASALRSQAAEANHV